MPVPIFVIDDTRSVTDSLVMRLRARRFDARPLYSLREARAKLIPLTHPSVFVLDHNFDGEIEVGWDFCNDLKSDLQDMSHMARVIYFSGRESFDEWERRCALERKASVSHTRLPDAFVDKADPQWSPKLLAAIASFHDELDA